MDKDARHRGSGRGIAAVVCGGLMLVLAGCATAPDPSDREALQSYQETNDPLEPFNRAMFDFNQFLDGILIKPLAIVYRGVLPEPARNGIRNALNNLRSPVILANDLFQGELDRAGTTVTRFVINTTAGVGGFMDRASDWGYKRHNEDFGQTLATHDVDEGPYLFLPLLGPAPVRDLAGNVVDIFLDPLTYVDGPAATVRFLVDGVALREENIETLDRIERTSIDYYATIRSLYRQRRAHEIANGDATPDSMPKTPGFLRSGASALLDPAP